MWPFNQKKTGPAVARNSKTHDLIKWETDAPPEWPVIQGPALPPGAPEGILTIYLAARLTEAFEGGPHTLELKQMASDMLVEEGVLSIPLIAKVNDRRFAVFCYADANETAAAHYAGASALIRAQSRLEPVYFAPQPLRQASPANPCREFGPDLFSPRDTAKTPGPDGDYAMWWATDEDPDFLASPERDDIHGCYTALEGILSYVLADLYGRLTKNPKPATRLQPPDEPILEALTGPEHRPLLLSVGAEKGLRFHLPVETTPLRYRRLFWKHFRGYCERWRAVAAQKSLPEDPAEIQGALEWWNLAQAAVRKAQSDGQNKVKQFGTMR